MARIKNASLWIEGNNPLVINTSTIRVNNARRSNHHRLQPNAEANPNKTAANIKKSSFVSK